MLRKMRLHDYAWRERRKDAVPYGPSATCGQQDTHHYLLSVWPIFAYDPPTAVINYRGTNRCSQHFHSFMFPAATRH
jgi:hypothetical protein